MAYSQAEQESHTVKSTPPVTGKEKVGDVAKTESTRILGGKFDVYWQWEKDGWKEISDSEYNKITSNGSTSAYSPLGTPSTTSGKSVRYPRNVADNKTDYVLFQFYDYVPPYKEKSPTLNSEGTQLSAYNWSATDSDQYKETTAKSIILYMPEDLSTGYKASWMGKNLSSTGAGMLQTAGQTNAWDSFTSSLDKVGEDWDKLGPISGAKALQKAISKVSGESLELNDIFGATRGVILNPNSELLFQGFDMRNFSLNYKLVPRNDDEAKDIKEIIKIFKTAMLPKSQPAIGTFPLFEGLSFNPLGGGGTGLKAGFIGIPNLCRVSFMRGGGLNPDVTQYKMCAITQVDINYTPDGTYATYSSGAMVAIGLSLSFQETKLVYSEEAWAY